MVYLFLKSYLQNKQEPHTHINVAQGVVLDSGQVMQSSNSWGSNSTPAALTCHLALVSEAWMIEQVFYQPDLPKASARNGAFRVKFVSM